MKRICPPGDPARSKIEKLRATRLEIENELEEVAVAALPIDEAMERVMQELRADTPVHDTLASYARPGSPPSLPGVTLPLLHVLFGEELETRIRAHLTAQTPSAGLPHEQRAKAIEKLRGKLRDLERQEELEVCALERDGFIVERNPEADPGVLLDVWNTL